MQFQIHFVIKLKKNKLMFDIIINFDFNVDKRDNVNRFTLIFQTLIKNIFRV